MFGAGDLETIFIIRPPARDPFGDPVPGGGQLVPVPNCLFAPGPTDEMRLQADQVQADGVLFCPPGTPVTPQDRLRIRGEAYEVAGRPRDWGRAGIEILVKIVTG